MELGLHEIRTTIFRNDFILFYIIFILCKFFYFYFFQFFFLYYVYVYFSFTYVSVILFCLRHVIFLYLCFLGVFETMQTSGMELLCEIVNSLQPLTVFSESFILDVCTGSECVSGYFVLTETINLLMQWWKVKLKSNKLLLFDLPFYFFIDKLRYC